MPRKPQDILAFLRSKGGEPGEEPAPAVEPSLGTGDAAAPKQPPRVFVLRRTQVYVALTATALFLVLAFQVGHVAGSRSRPRPDAAAPTSALDLWTVRAITYDNSDQGRADAARIVRMLEKAGLSPSIRANAKSVVVVVGAWLRNPKEDPAAAALVETVRDIKDAAGRTQFPDAAIWQIER
jgi:hypothetical protein